MNDSYEFNVKGHRVILNREEFTIDGTAHDWYKNKSGNNWIPKKDSVRGLIKQIIEE